MTGFITPAPYGSGNAESAFSRLIGRGNSGRGNAPKTASPGKMTACNSTPSNGESLSGLRSGSSDCSYRLRKPASGASRNVEVGGSGGRVRRLWTGPAGGRYSSAVAVSRASRAERGSSPAPQRARATTGTAASHASEEPAERARSPPSGANETARSNVRAQARPTPPRTGPCLLRPFAGSAALLLAGRSAESVKSGVAR